MTSVGNNKGFTVVEGLLLVILLVLLGAIGYFVYERSNDEIDEETPIASVTENEGELPSDTGDSEGPTTDASGIEYTFEANGKNVMITHPSDWLKAELGSNLGALMHPDGYKLSFTSLNTELPELDVEDSSVTLGGNQWSKKLFKSNGNDEFILYIPDFEAPFVNAWLDLPDDASSTHVEEAEQILATLSITEQ